MKPRDLALVMLLVERIHPTAEVNKDHEFGFNVYVTSTPTTPERDLLREHGLKYNEALRCYFPVRLKK